MRWIVIAHGMSNKLLDLSIQNVSRETFIIGGIMKRLCKVIAIQNVDYVNKNKKRVEGQRVVVRELNEHKVMDECYLTIVWVSYGYLSVGDNVIVERGKFGDYIPNPDLEIEGI